MVLPNAKFHHQCSVKTKFLQGKLIKAATYYTPVAKREDHSNLFDYQQCVVLHFDGKAKDENMCYFSGLTLRAAAL